MSRLITYMIKYSDGSFSIKNDIFEKPLSKENIQSFIEEKKEENVRKLKDLWYFANQQIECLFISITTLEE